MAGETTLEGSIDWINERRKEIKKRFHWPKGFPVRKTYIDATASCDHHEVARVIAQVLLKARAVERCDDEPSRLVAHKEVNDDQLIHTAVDGKMLRGTDARMAETISHLSTCCPFMSAKVGLCSINFSSTRKTMKNRLA